MTYEFFFDIAVVVILSAVLAWLSLLTRQPIIVAYILSGVLLGPWGLKVVSEIGFIDQVSHIGVTLLLFLAGLTLHPQRMFTLFRRATLLTLSSSLVFGVLAAGLALACRFSLGEAVIVGVACTFSSTILVIKLLPTVTLHQRHMGAVCIAVLVVQDILAVLALLLIQGGASNSVAGWARTLLLGVSLAAGAVLAQRYVLRYMMRQVEYYHEVLYLLALAWCFALAVVAKRIGLSHEIGAFVAGVALASNSVSLFLSEGLKFFRDFFLVLFFFALGARLDLLVLQAVLLPATCLAVGLLLVKPIAYALAFRIAGESREFSREIGTRLGQASEFSLIVALTAYHAGVIRQSASQLIQLATILTMIVSSYIVVFLYPTPLGTRKALKQD
jgi:Kef-type K+ transport system membrane component KefB